MTKRITYLDRYRVLADETGAPRELRRSGAAVTYKAEDINSGREMAVELISAFGLRARDRDELQREAETAKQINHVNIPTLVAFSAEAEHLIYVAEYFEGTSLETWVTTHGPMPVGSVFRIALQVVSGLGAAASHGILHDAINPRNVILVPGQTPQGDWPLVKILGLVGVAPTFDDSRAAAEEANFGAKFASPEQLQRGTVDFRSEIYSLGATLWFLLTGAAPVAGATLRRPSGVAKPAVQLLQQMLAPNPSLRPHNPLALQEEIRACLGQTERRDVISRKLEGPLAAAVPVLMKEPRRAGRWKPLALAALFVGLAGVGAFFAPENRQPRQLFARFSQTKPIGVPIGVPDAAARAEPSALPEQTSELAPAAIVANEPEEAASAPAAVIASTSASESEPNEQSEPSVLEELPPSDPTEEVNAYANQPEAVTPPPDPPAVENQIPEPAPQLVATNESMSEVAEEAEPAPPSEGPEETADPPNYAAEEAELVAQVSAAAATPAAPESPAPEASGTPAAILPRLDRPLAAEPAPAVKGNTKGTKRPKQIDGMEVRAAEPVDEADLAPPPEAPARSDGAQFIGIAPDGSLIFDAPPVERRSGKPRR